MKQSLPDTEPRSSSFDCHSHVRVWPLGTQDASPLHEHVKGHCEGDSFLGPSQSPPPTINTLRSLHSPLSTQLSSLVDTKWLPHWDSQSWPVSPLATPTNVREQLPGTQSFSPAAKAEGCPSLSTELPSLSKLMISQRPPPWAPSQPFPS